MQKHPSSAVAITLATLALSGCLTLRSAATDDDAVWIPPLHVGDVYGYAYAEEEWVAGSERSHSQGQSVLHVEGPSEASDRHGILRPTTLIRMNDSARQYACHLLWGGIENVRWDLEAGEPFRWNAETLPGAPAGLSVGGRETALNTYYRGTCDLMPGLSDRILRVGDRLSADHVNGLWAFAMLTADSEPAIATEHEGRRAMLVAWVEGSLRVEAVFAEGIPTFVRLGFVDADPAIAERDWRGESRLTGFAPGDGAPLRDEGARLYERAPGTRFSAFDPMAFDDGPWQLRFTMEEALTALRLNPAVPFDEWRAAHPDAVLVGAFYASNPSWVGFVGDEWRFHLVDRTAHAWFFAVRRAVDPAADDVLPSALRPTLTYYSEGPRREDTPFPENVAPLIAASDAMIALAASAGVHVSHVGRLQLHLFDDRDVWGDDVWVPYLWVDNMDSLEETSGRATTGEAAWIDAADGSLVSTHNLTRRLHAPAVLAPDGVAPRSSVGASPTDVGWRAAATAASALVALALIAKLAVVLYTRLVRERLLDDPVRAALVERIRAEPGIHREALVSFVGIGNGATRHHLDKLIAHRLVIEIHASRSARYYTAGEITPDVARRHAALQVGRAYDVYELVVAQPDLTLREMARRLGMSAPGVHRVRQRLKRDGLLPVGAPLLPGEVPPLVRVRGGA